MLKLKIERNFQGVPMMTPRGNKSKTQFTLERGAGTYFVSYNTVIALFTYEGKIYLDKHYWDYSATTARYRREFLGEGIDETREAIKAGKYKLLDLNYY